ncbi:MAG: tRNA lysidine(34) synthetase TilS, partial [bacterium]
MQSLPHIVRENLFALGAESDDACLVGLSGGADSTALILSTGGPGSAWKGPVVAAHLDHGVRECSASDRMWVENLCRELAVPLITHRIGDGELPALRKKTRSLEAAMRRIRYAFLLDAARSSGAKWVLTGLTSDDQVETVLFRVLRRMDPRSLAGIPPRREIILRPMLGV